MSYGISKFSNEEITYIYYYRIKKETPDAIEFNTDFGRIWIPKSQVKDKDVKMFAIPTWLAKRKGIKTNSGGLL